MRRAIVAVALAMSAIGACAESTVPPSAKIEAPVATRVAAIDAGVADAGVADAGDGVDAASLATLDALAARAPSVAAGMREVARGEVAASTARVIATADDRDVCARVAIDARPLALVHAWLTDARGDVLADAKDATDATLAAHGPVCVRRGDAISLHLESSAAFIARFVAWESP